MKAGPRGRRTGRTRAHVDLLGRDFVPRGRHLPRAADFWRFIVVHLRVEDFLELFTTVMVAYMFVLLGVVRERVALTVIFVDIVLYSAGGVIGTAHHMYFNGEPAEVLALGASSRRWRSSR